MQFIVKNTDSAHEHISNKLLIYLYNFVKRNYSENNNSLLQGHIETLYGYQSNVDYLEETYQNLHILLSRDTYIEFEDELCKQYVSNVLGDSCGVTENDVKDLTIYDIGNIFRLPNGVEKFNELKYFKSLTLLKSISGDIYNNPCEMFQNAKNTLKEINLKNITEIYGATFQDFINLEKINDSQYITKINSNNTFKNTGLKTVNIPNLTYNRGAIFQECHNLISVTIDGTITAILDSLFRDCENLKIINGYSNITQIHNDVFYNCSNLMTLNIPIENVTYIGSNVFYNCSSLNMENLDFTNVTIFRNYAFQRSNVKQFTFTDQPLEIYEGCFKDCKELTSIVIPNNLSTSLKTTTNTMFNGCSKLTSITLPSNQINFTIEGFFAAYCTLLTTVNNMENCQIIGRFAFDHCSSLTTINLSNVDSIGDSAFYGCTSLESIDLSNCTTLQNYNVFRECKKLWKIQNTNKIVSISSNSFNTVGIESEHDMTHIYLPKLLILTDYVFANSAVKTIEFRDLIEIRGNSLSNCKKLTTITGLDNVTILGNHVFNGDSSLISISLPICTSVGYNIFSNCTALTNISMPLLQSVGSNFIENCKNLNTVDLRGVTSISANNSFNGANFVNIDLRSLENIEYEGVFRDKTNLTTVNVNSLQTAKRYLFYGCTSLTTINLPSMTALPQDGFRNCSNLTTVNISNNCIEIGQSCFNTCSKLVNIDLSHIQTIGPWAFENCTSLASIDISSCTEILQGAFMGCTGLNTDIVVPAVITELPIECFWGAKRINSLTLLSNTVIPWKTRCLEYADEVRFPIYVPDALVNDYKVANEWIYIANRIKPLSEKPIS